MAAGYGLDEARNYVEAAPHLKHSDLRALYDRIVGRVADELRADGVDTPRVLDLGAGQGDASMPFLRRGAEVVAVDDSEAQLDRFREAAGAPERLSIVLQDAQRYLAGTKREFDVLVLSSFLHHVPDYVSFLRSAVAVLASGAHVVTYQDPLEYRALPRAVDAYSRLAYLTWRIRQPDAIGGLSRRARRNAGVWRDDCPQDVIEYHATRGGVDHRAVVAVLEQERFEVEVVRYFSTQSPLFHRIGTRIGMENTFAIHARRRA